MCFLEIKILKKINFNIVLAVREKTYSVMNGLFFTLVVLTGLNNVFPIKSDPIGRVLGGGSLSIKLTETLHIG